MATKYWRGDAVAVKQVSTVTITGNDVATTYKVTIGNHTVSVVGNAGGATSTAADLKAALAASTHPYFTAVVWTQAGAIVTGTAATAGVPFVFTASVTGGAGTISQATTTASSGPNDWSTAANWSDGIVPASTDTVYFQDNSVNVAWGLAQSAVTLAKLVVKKSYTGRIGLDYRAFATSADGATTDASKVEYRDVYLAISATIVELGEKPGSGSPAGSGRIMLDLGANASTITVYDTASTPSETGRSAVRLKCNHASTDLYVRLAPGGVGIASEVPGETSTLRKVSISDEGAQTRVQLSSGVTLTTWEQLGGNNALNAAGTIASATVWGGVLTTEGDYTVTTGQTYGGTWNANHKKTAGNAFTTLNLDGGTVDGTGSKEARTWATVNARKGSTLVLDGTDVSITTFNDDTKTYRLTVQ